MSRRALSGGKGTLRNRFWKFKMSNPASVLGVDHDGGVMEGLVSRLSLMGPVCLG